MEITKDEAEKIELLICGVIIGQLYDEGYTDVIPPQYYEEAQSGGLLPRVNGQGGAGGVAVVTAAVLFAAYKKVGRYGT